MEHKENENTERLTGGGILSWVGRLILVAVVLGITSFFTPGFTITGLWSYIIAAVVITAIDYLVERFMKVDAAPFGKGFKGFAIAAIILYLAQFIVPNMRVTILGAILAALVIGVVDAIIPGRAM